MCVCVCASDTIAYVRAPCPVSYTCAFSARVLCLSTCPSTCTHYRRRRHHRQQHLYIVMLATSPPKLKHHRHFRQCHHHYCTTTTTTTPHTLHLRSAAVVVAVRRCAVQFAPPHHLIRMLFALAHVRRRLCSPRACVFFRVCVCVCWFVCVSTEGV